MKPKAIMCYDIYDSVITCPLVAQISDDQSSVIFNRGRLGVDSQLLDSNTMLFHNLGR